MKIHRFDNSNELVLLVHQLQVGLIEVSGNSVTKKHRGGLRMPRRLPYASNNFFSITLGHPLAYAKDRM